MTRCRDGCAATPREAHPGGIATEPIKDSGKQNDAGKRYRVYDGNGRVSTFRNVVGFGRVSTIIHESHVDQKDRPRKHPVEKD